MDVKKAVKSAVGGAALGAGYAAKLAKWGLNASEVVFNGAINLANSFVHAPKLGIGDALFGGLKQATGTISQSLIKKGKELMK